MEAPESTSRKRLTAPVALGDVSSTPHPKIWYCGKRSVSQVYLQALAKSSDLLQQPGGNRPNTHVERCSRDEE